MSAKRTAILISGRGSNMVSLIEAAAETGYPAEIVGVISDQPAAPGLALAAQLGIPVQALPRADFADKAPTQLAAEGSKTSAIPVLPADGGGIAVFVLIGVGVLVVVGLLVFLRRRFRYHQ